MNDFTAWANWLNTDEFTISQLREAYDLHYSCECDTCRYRKANGFRPYRTDNPKCHAPIDGIASIEEIARLLKA